MYTKKYCISDTDHDFWCFWYQSTEKNENRVDNSKDYCRPLLVSENDSVDESAAHHARELQVFIAEELGKVGEKKGTEQGWTSHRASCDS